MNDIVISDRYRIEFFSNSSDKNFVKALDIYSKFTPSNIKTNTNEITYWLDNYNKIFKDRLLIFGLFLENKVIGYLQLVYFKKENFIFIDYITIDKIYRQFHVFSIFLDLVRIFFEKNKFDVNFLITEIEYDEQINQPSKSGKSLIRLLKQHGFGVIKSKYIQPQLGIYNHDSKTSAVLMYYSENEKKYISKKTYLMILNKIYLEYYCRWYKPLLTVSEFNRYKEDIFHLYDKITKNKLQDKININGYKDIFNINSRSNENKPIKNTFTSSIIIFILLFGLLTLFILTFYLL